MRITHPNNADNTVVIYEIDPKLNNALVELRNDVERAILRARTHPPKARDRFILNIKALRDELDRFSREVGSGMPERESDRYI